jgi:MFS family permease
MDRRGVALLAVLAFAQDAIYALIFLTYMNHYLLVVLKASPGLPAYTLALYGATRLVIHPIAGKLIDSTSPRLVFRASIIIQLGGVALLLFAHGLAVFLVATVLLAAGAASVWPLIYETLARTQPQAAHGEAAGMLTVVGYVGTGAGLLSGVLLGRFVHRPAAFLLTGAFVALAGVTQGSGHFDKTIGVASSAKTGPGKTLAARIASSGPTRGGRIVFFGLIMFLDFAAISSLAGVYGPFTRISLGIDLLTTVLLLIPTALAAAVSLFVASRKSRPQRRLKEMSILYSLAGAGALGLAAFPTPSIALVIAVALGAGAGGIGPIVAATVVDLSGTGQRGLVVGSLLAVEGLGSVAGPAIVGFITDLLSPRAGMAAIGLIFGALMVITASGYRREPVAAVRSGSLPV